MFAKKLKAINKPSPPMLGLMGLSLIMVALMISSPQDPIRIIPLDLPTIPVAPRVINDVLPVYDALDIPDYKYRIQSGNSLSQIFSILGIPYGDLLGLMDADQNHLRIDTLQPNNVLNIWMDNTGKHLAKLEIEFNIISKVQYRRLEDGSYDFEAFTIEGEWIKTVIQGDIKGSFSESGQRFGLTYNEIEFIANLLKDKINFNRDLRYGDKFDVVRVDQYVNGVASEQNEIQAVRFSSRGKLIAAYLHQDGNYYDKKGDSLQRAFQRYPTVKKYRISSHFNPRRKHPVTGRAVPHNGTDFAVNIGTPVVTTGDGIVVLTQNHLYAGKYVVIDHGNQLRTRYLHNSKILVRKGQRVARGQLIALSGKSGRVTGPHIHYEMLQRSHPVDPMKAYIPMVSSVTKKEMSTFVKASTDYDKLMERVPF